MTRTINLKVLAIGGVNILKTRLRKTIELLGYINKWVVLQRRWRQV